MQTGKVARGALVIDVRVTGMYDDNPILGYVVYQVEFLDGHVTENATNIIAENILKQVDLEGFLLTMMEVTVNYKR